MPRRASIQRFFHPRAVLCAAALAFVACDGTTAPDGSDGRDETASIDAQDDHADGFDVTIDSRDANNADAHEIADTADHSDVSAIDAFDAHDAFDVPDAFDAASEPVEDIPIVPPDEGPDIGPRLLACPDGAVDTDAALDADTDGSASAPSLATDIQPIFDAHCNCHQSAGHEAPLLFAGLSYGQLVCKPAPVACRATAVLVAPGDPDHSALYLRVAGTSCYEQMPLGGPYLTPAEIALVHDWIASGANP